MNGDEANNKKLIVALVAGLALTGTCLAAPHGGPRGFGGGHGPAPMHHFHHHHHHGHHGGWIVAGAAALVGGVLGALCIGR